jgi:hypothetical protein
MESIYGMEWAEKKKYKQKQTKWRTPTIILAQELIN